jgi:hypothetical protein
MKPFNLEAALAGEPVVTRNGRPVKIAGYNEGLGSLIGWVDDRPKEWDKDGIWNTIFEIGGRHDLFMAENQKVKIEGWVNVYSNTERVCDDSFVAATSHAYKSKKEAKRFASPSCIDTVKIEWEEEA